MLIDKFYTIESKEENRAVVRLSDENHPLFKAHFPDAPIMPGFVNFEIVSDVFDIDIVAIKKAKFLDKALPNQTLIYERDGNKFKVICNDKEIASFSL